VNHYAVLCLTGALVISLYDLPAASSQTQKRFKHDLETVVRDYELLELDPARVLEQVRRTGELSLTSSEGAFHLVLTPHDMRAENYRAEEVLDGGVVRAVAPGAVRTYKGIVRGMEGAQARFTIDGETIEGLIITRGQKYFVEPAARYSPSANQREYLFYKESDVIKRLSGKCGVTVAEKIGAEVERVQSSTFQTSSRLSTSVHTELITPQREVELATDADFEYFQALGSTTAVFNEILSIMNQVEGVYDAEIGLNFRIVFQNVYTTSENPYPDIGDAQAELDRFRNFWNTNRVDVARDLAHLWTGKDFGLYEGVLGIAYLNVVCNNPSESYALSTWITSLPFKYILTAHEIAHNFSATHVDGLSGCASTIMQSLLLNGGNTFCGVSRGQIEAHATANSGCLSLSGCTFIISPVGQSVSATGGSGSVNVTARSECVWTAVSNVAWITIISGNSSRGNGTVSYSVAANIGDTSRTGTVVIAGQSFSVSQAANTLTPPPPTILTEENTGRAIALDSVTLMRDPFPIVTRQNFSLDGHTRIMLFAVNLNLMTGEDASIVTAQAEDSQQRIFPLVVEFVGKVPGFDWLTQVNLKLPDDLTNAGDIGVRIHLRNTASNRAIVAIR